MTKNDAKTNKTNPQQQAELLDTPRIEQLKLLIDETIFDVFAFIDRQYGRVAAFFAWLFNLLPIKREKRESARKLTKIFAIVFGVIFLIMLIGSWLNPLLGFICIMGMAAAVFYWPDIALKIRAYKERKRNTAE